MRPPPEPRLARVIRELDRVTRELHEVTRHIDDLHADVIDMLREDTVTLESIGECYDPPKSRQGVKSWLRARRRPSRPDGGNGRRTRVSRRGDAP